MKDSTYKDIILKMLYLSYLGDKVETKNFRIKHEPKSISLILINGTYYYEYEREFNISLTDNVVKGLYDDEALSNTNLYKKLCDDYNVFEKRINETIQQVETYKSRIAVNKAQIIERHLPLVMAWLEKIQVDDDLKSELNSIGKLISHEQSRIDELCAFKELINNRIQEAQNRIDSYKQEINKSSSSIKDRCNEVLDSIKLDCEIYCDEYKKHTIDYFSNKINEYQSNIIKKHFNL